MNTNPYGNKSVTLMQVQWDGEARTVAVRGGQATDHWSWKEAHSVGRTLQGQIGGTFLRVVPVLSVPEFMIVTGIPTGEVDRVVRQHLADLPNVEL